MIRKPPYQSQLCRNRLCPKVALEEHQEHAHRHGAGQVKDKAVLASGTFRRQLHPAQFIQKQTRMQVNVTHAGSAHLAHELTHRGCAIPACSCRPPAPGPQPVAGLCHRTGRSRSSNLRSRPSPETLAFSGPTSGLTIVSKRVCSESGSARKSNGLPAMAAASNHQR